MTAPVTIDACDLDDLFDVLGHISFLCVVVAAELDELMAARMSANHASSAELGAKADRIFEVLESMCSEDEEAEQARMLQELDDEAWWAARDAGRDLDLDGGFA